jgi:NAD+ synthase
VTDLASASSASKQQVQQEIARDLQVSPTFDAGQEIERRVAFLAEQLTSARLRALVLGISGGVDSTTAGRLCQLAVERVRAAGGEATFYAMRLPYGVQADEKDAQMAIDFIRADKVLTVDVKPASDAALEAVLAGDAVFRDEHHQDFVLGNIKARQRMVAQYAVAAAHDGLVVGTDHAAEAVSGFFTKFGDGAADVVPLTGLTKRRVRAVAEALGAPVELVHKTPTADLETLAPGKPDEDALGVTYNDIDDFLEGKAVTEGAFESIVRRYRITEHKRQLPIAPERPTVSV